MEATTLSHYRVLELLGKGGMGEVYRAEDATLKREVALKILPAHLASSQERLERFQREAETLAALNHPNIVHAYTVEEDEGTHFLTMELVEGQPLSHWIRDAGMALEQIFEIAVPLTEAIAAAHEKGVVHRDLKPANVMVTDDGRVKVLDFGLAKLRPEAEIDLATELPTEPLTEEGKIVGTMPYMSPEQLEGKEVDARSDIFSLGVVLYEMATGERPFKGDSSASLIAAIMTGSPREVDSLRADLPHHLSRIIRHCLEKEPRRRYQSALDVHNELQDLQREESLSAAVPVPSGPEPEPAKKPVRWPLVAAGLAGAAIVLAVLVALWLGRSQPPTEALAEPAAAAKESPPMIVVLPFENLGDPEDEYFADGMTEEITSRLAVVSGLRVISRTSAMQYKENRPPMKQIGEELGVDYVLEGSVRWAPSVDGPGRVRITPQLIRVADDTHLWADSYERLIDDIFAIRSEIAENVASELGVTLLDTEHTLLAAEPTDNSAAYRAYLQGLETWRQSRGDWLEMSERSARLFGKAVELDPTFARAWARLSIAKLLFVWNAQGLAPEWVSEAKEALDRALELAPEDPYVRHAQGRYYYHGLRDFDRALREFQAVQIELPSDSDVADSIAAIHRRQGQFEKAIDSYEQALLLDPLNISHWRELSWTYLAMRRFFEALGVLDEAIEIAGDNTELYWEKAYYLTRMGSIVDARKVLAGAPVTGSMNGIRGLVEFLDRDYETALGHFESVPDQVISEIMSWLTPWRADTLVQLNRNEEAREILQRFASKLEGLIAGGSDQPHGQLGLTYARLGRADDAIRELNQSIDLMAEDSLDGPRMKERLAYAYAILGEADAAVAIFDQLLETPYGDPLTSEFLRLDPRLDPIRDHPRFQALLEKYGEEEGP